MIRPNFCTTVMTEEYDWKEQIEAAIRSANNYHKRRHEECPPPYFMLDVGKVYGIAVGLEKAKARIAELEAENEKLINAISYHHESGRVRDMVAAFSENENCPICVEMLEDE